MQVENIHVGVYVPFRPDQTHPPGSVTEATDGTAHQIQISAFWCVIEAFAHLLREIPEIGQSTHLLYLRLLF